MNCKGEDKQQRKENESQTGTQLFDFGERLIFVHFIVPLYIRLHACYRHDFVVPILDV
jgi:hypothetical protein